MHIYLKYIHFRNITHLDIFNNVIAMKEVLE